MAKKIKFESFKYRFLIAAQNMPFSPELTGQPVWGVFLQSLGFDYEKGKVVIAWEFAKSGSLSVQLDEPRFYLRGDSDREIQRQQESGLMGTEDPIKLKNDSYFKEIVMQVAESAGYKKTNEFSTAINQRIQYEREFHDAWADSEDVDSIDIRKVNEACTAPEMRFIVERLGDIRGKRLLDVGCGLGEASVYFALLGADVTSSDLSKGMLNATAKLASANGVSVKLHIASAEDMHLAPDAQFDIIYAGNLLHHVDIDETLSRVKPHLAKGGCLVTWDPLVYNPAINIYRSMATNVRTPDEHPLKWRDIQLFHKHFAKVETHYFWFTTLIIFMIMALVQGRNPNKERFWKVVVQEGEKWRWLYSPLEKMDRLLLSLLPQLRLLCWNVVVVSFKN